MGGKSTMGGVGEGSARCGASLQRSLRDFAPPPGTKTVLAITPSRGFRGRQQLILGTKWISLPIFPSSVFLSRFHLRVLSDTSCPVGAAAWRGCRLLFGIDWEPDRKLLLCLFVTSGLNCFLLHHNCWNTGKRTLPAGLCFHIGSSQTPSQNAAENKGWSFTSYMFH